MPLINLLRPRIADRAPDLGRTDRVIADLGMTIGMRIDPTAKMARQHLGAEADAEKRLCLLQRHRDPVGLATHELVCIVGAGWATEDDGAGVLRKRFRQRIAKAWMADVKRMAALLQRMANATGRGIVAVQDGQNRLER